jgi:phage major head subunit gpT-like protein
MELTRENLQKIYMGFSTKLNEGMAQVDTSYLKWCEVNPSTAPIENYPIVQLNSGMQEWIGPRQISTLSGQVVQIKNKPFANGVEVDRDDLFFDRMGLYNSKFIELGIGKANLYPSLATLILLINPTWADGRPFFVADRILNPDKKKIILDNLVAGGFSVENFKAARLKGRSMTDAVGKSLKLFHDHLIVGPKHEDLANAMKNSEYITQGVTNTLKGTFTLEINGDFIGEYEDDFRLLCTTRGAKPVVVQKVKESGLTAVDSENDSWVFFNKKNLYGVDCLGNAGPGIPQLAVAGIKP